MGERIKIGINTSHARKGAVQKEVRDLAGVEGVSLGNRETDIHTMIALVSPERALQLLEQIGRIKGVEHVVELPQTPADEAGLQPV